MKKWTLCFAGCALSLTAWTQNVWEAPTKNGEANHRALLACWRLSQGWFQYADPETGLLPHDLTSGFYWNAKDCAADNYPFLVLTACFTDKELLENKLRPMLETEQRLCNRVGRLPDDYDFATKTFRTKEPKIADLIFGASEYAKDGLTPLTEWLGPSPWSNRMLDLIDDIWKHADINTEAGAVPTDSHEVAGDLLQCMSRMYWMTREPRYKEWTYRLATYFFDYHLPTQANVLGLDDHGCEVIGGLAEAYFIAAHEDPELREKWKPAMHAILDRVLEVGRDENGLMYNRVNPVTGAILDEERTDNWGYNYNAFSTVGTLDNVEAYHAAIRHVLSNLWAVRDYPWEGARADGFADSLEGCINLMNRYPNQRAFEWADYTFDRHMKLQRDTGVFEGWYGDGNSARTSIMYALWKSQGCYAESWRADLRVGAVSMGKEGVRVEVRSEWPWTGKLRFDVPRHKENLKMPTDYPRLNQFPEWFTVDKDKKYSVEMPGANKRTVSAQELRDGWPIQVTPDAPCRLIVREEK